MRCAFALTFVLSAAAPALGQDAEPDVVSLRVEACGVTWASPEVLASLLRVELRTSSSAVDVILVDGDASLTVRAASCGPLLDLQARDDGGLIARRVDLSDTAAELRARALALVLADLWRARPAVLPPTPPPLAVRRSLADPARAPVVEASAPPVDAGPVERASPAAPPRWQLHGGGALELVAADPRALGGAWLGARFDLAGPLFLGAALHGVGGRGEDPLGSVDLALFSLSVEAGIAIDLAPFALGALLELRPGLVWADAQAGSDAVSARAELDGVVDLGLFVSARLALTDALFVMLEVGVRHALHGYEARSPDRRVIGFTEWVVPARLALGARL